MRCVRDFAPPDVLNLVEDEFMKTRLMAVLLGLAVTIALPAQSFRGRQQDQRARINHGVRSGELTPGEASRLYSRSFELTRRYARDRRDGAGLSLTEQRRLHRAQNQLSRSIYREKHDRQDW